MDARFDLPCAAKSLSMGEQHFGSVVLNDKRLVARTVLTADAMMRHPGGTLPEKLSKPELLAFYDLANNPKVNHDNMLAGHCQFTREKMTASAGVVLVIHDTTETDFSGLDIADLGPIGHGGCRGLLVHNVLALDYDAGEVLGLIGQITHKRRMVRKGETPKAKREHPERESRLWIKGVNAVGAVPSGRQWVNLMDRGGDTFESMERQHTLEQRFVLRSKSNRKVQVHDKSGRLVKRKLHHWARKLPRLGERMVKVAAQGDQPPREASVAVACAPVILPPPAHKRGQHGDEPLALWVIHLKEVNAPKGCTPLEWFLLTNVPTSDRQQAWERVDWYERRPMVEEYHKALKTGCGVELVQFTTRKALEVTLAMLSVVAVQLLRLRDLSRRPEAELTLASQVIDKQYVEVLCLWRYRGAQADLTVKEFLYALARLGGHLGRKHDHLPGWLVLWRGWTELQRLVEGARLVRLKRSG
jgi:hypothetical protein